VAAAAAHDAVMGRATLTQICPEMFAVMGLFANIQSRSPERAIIGDERVEVMTIRRLAQN
jgi:hypothetical protein